jgi:putative transposase
MPRGTRIVIPGTPHHITQRGNRRQQVFYEERDYTRFLETLRATCKTFRVEIWAWALMPNHVHLIAVPPEERSLSIVMGLVTQKYALELNTRKTWQGHLWQARFYSCPMDPSHAMMAARYIELNPVRAGLANDPSEWRFSSARAHFDGVDDGLTNAQALLKEEPDWRGFVAGEESAVAVASLRKHTRTGKMMEKTCLTKSLGN